MLTQLDPFSRQHEANYEVVCKSACTCTTNWSRSAVFPGQNLWMLLDSLQRQRANDTTSSGKGVMAAMGASRSNSRSIKLIDPESSSLYELRMSQSPGLSEEATRRPRPKNLSIEKGLIPVPGSGHKAHGRISRSYTFTTVLVTQLERGFPWGRSWICRDATESELLDCWAAPSTDLAWLWILLGEELWRICTHGWIYQGLWMHEAEVYWLCVTHENLC